MQGAEFLAMILVIVYVGAVAVLFLFVVMMLDTPGPGRIRGGFYRFFGLVIGAVFLVQLVVYFASQGVEIAMSDMIIAHENNLHALGMVLYDDYFVVFQLAGLILLVAMIGAIVLTLRKRTNVKRQDIAQQVARRREDAVELKTVESGEGI